MIITYRKILAQNGVKGLWRGCWPNVQRAALVNLGDLSTYDYVKMTILKHTNLKDNTLTHCLSSACAGYVYFCLFTFHIGANPTFYPEIPLILIVQKYEFCKKNDISEM